MLSVEQQRIKRFIDVIVSVFGILISSIPLVIIVLFSSLSTRSFGVFFQERVGKNAEIFILYKIKTMRILTSGENRLTWFGRSLRKLKLDELPQLFNVLFGDMSIVGPRPDVPGYADALEGEDRIVLSVKPGITGPATLLFLNEEEILAQQEDSLQYNDSVLWPQKVKINIDYIKNWSLVSDFKLMIATTRLIFIKKGKINT